MKIIKTVKHTCEDDKKIVTQMAERKALCPICHKSGEKVSNLTVEHLTKDTTKNISKDDVYFLCMSEDCDIVYYNDKQNIIFTKEQLVVPVWFKSNANPKYICYCNKVTEEQIINAVLKDGAKDINDIARLTGAMKSGNCKFNNPLGKCCSRTIQQTIDKALNGRTL
jgi:bacterioferritin-associated ferredoxin